MSFYRALQGLFILGVLAYVNAVGNPFVHDDVVFILRNPKVHHLGHIGELLPGASIAPLNIAVVNSYYRPFLDIVYCMEYWFFGPNPAGYHIVNILLHLINGVLVYILISGLTRRPNFSWAAAVLFVVHPVQSESVACISGISNLLFSFFCLISFILYLRIADGREDLSPARAGLAFSGALLAFGLALLCKEQAIVLPGLIALYEFVLPSGPQGRNTGWRLRLSGFAIVAGGYLLWRKLILGGFLTTFIAGTGEFFLRLKAIPAMALTYLRIFILPYDLHYYRSHDILSPWGIPFLGLFFVCVLFWGTWRLLPKAAQGLFGFGLGWLMICLLPTSLVPLVHEYSWIAAFEHFLYLPLLGLLLCALLGAEYFVERVFRKKSPVMKKSFLAAAVFICIWVTFQQNRTWAGEVPLFEKVVKYESHLGRARLLLAKAYYFQGDYAGAKAEFLKGRDIMAGYLVRARDPNVRPFYEGFLKESMMGIAACDQGQADLPAAVEQYEKILAMFPGDSDSHNNLGFIAIRMEKWDAAVPHFQEALKQDPHNAQVLTNLGVCYIQQGRLDKAEELFRAALAADAGFLTARRNLEQLVKQKTGNIN